MSRYFIFRVLSVIPILLLLSLVAFFLSKNVSTDPVISYLQHNSADAITDDFEVQNNVEYKRVFKLLNLDKAPFYFSVVPQYYDELYYLKNKKDLAALRKQNSKLFLPNFRWHGINNQYHHWIVKVFSFDFGISLSDGRPVSQKIIKALSWTSLLVFFGVGLMLIIGIPIGILSVKPNPSRSVKAINVFLYALYAMPVFWFATLMVMFFTTDEYGSWTNIFPSVGASFFTKGLLDKVSILLLPIIIISLHTAGLISRQMRNGIVSENGLPYSTTSKSKGLTQAQTIINHNLKNALLPMITIVTGIIPSAFAGSLIIEVIFGIPGIGRLLYSSIQLSDWNLVFGLLMVIGFITVISYLVGDLLYSWVNPKIRFNTTQA